MKKSKFIPVVAFMLAIAAAFGTQAANRTADPLSAVEFQGSTCSIDPDCHTLPTGTVCDMRYPAGDGCQNQVPAWRK